MLLRVGCNGSKPTDEEDELSKDLAEAADAAAAEAAEGDAEGAEGTEGEPFGFVNVLLESEPPHREVTTELMIGIEGEPSTNELTLTPRSDGNTLLCVVVTWRSVAVLCDIALCCDAAMQRRRV